MASEIGWELYHTFLAVLSEGSLSSAARALDITQPTAGRHIAALEKALDASLFTRSHAGLLPTDAALELRGYAEAMASTAAALRRTAASRRDAVAGTVRISASEIVGVEVLPPILAGLRERYPSLKVELFLTDRVQDLLRHEADVAVRMVQPQQSVLVARHVGPVALGLYARRDYLDRNGTPRNLAEVARHTFIGFDTETPFLRAFVRQLGGMGREALSLRTDSGIAQLAMIRAGCGIGVCQVALARRDPELVRLLPRQVAPRLETWITMHKDLRSSPRCRVTFDALFDGLHDYIQSTG
jgi:DNA-binding transcriptional LysR family regulator